VQCDKRGQIVIPKDIRQELGITEGTGFWLYSVDGEGIILKKIEQEELGYSEKIISEMKEKSEKIGVKEKNIDKTIKKYKKTKEGKLEVL
jgi:AbrB family looped-hinge helix DNA binding protein